MAALLNDGSGTFTDGTALVFGSSAGILLRGALAVAQLTNDPMPDLIQHRRMESFCGPRVLLQRSNSYCFLLLNVELFAAALSQWHRHLSLLPSPAAASAFSSSCAPASECSHPLRGSPVYG
jgi:hypothetical protein